MRPFQFIARNVSADRKLTIFYLCNNDNKAVICGRTLKAVTACSRKLYVCRLPFELKSFVGLFNMVVCICSSKLHIPALIQQQCSEVSLSVRRLFIGSFLCYAACSSGNVGLDRYSVPLFVEYASRQIITLERIMYWYSRHSLFVSWYPSHRKRSLRVAILRKDCNRLGAESCFSNTAGFFFLLFLRVH